MAALSGFTFAANFLELCQFIDHLMVLLQFSEAKGGAHLRVLLEVGFYSESKARIKVVWRRRPFTFL